jgi:hypothetical protein
MSESSARRMQSGTATLPRAIIQPALTVRNTDQDITAAVPG